MSATQRSAEMGRFETGYVDWHISAMMETDIDRVLLLERISFKKPWNRAAFQSELSSSFSICYAGKTMKGLECGNIIAYICSQLVADELSILKIAVDPDWRCKGVGNALLNRSIATAVANGAGTVFLEVRPSNQAALLFYRQQGFQIVGKRPNYYPETGEDALVMSKQLKEKGR